MTPIHPTADHRQEFLFFWTLVVLSLLMTLKYFPGLEATAPYTGNVFQMIHPDAFARDPFFGGDRPWSQRVFQLSLFYLGPKLMGEIWLDDRFTVIVYLILVVLSLVGIDRIVKLCGVTDVVPRFIVQLIFMRDHQYLTLTATFAHQPDLNHAAFAIPSIIWLIYATLARKPLWLILATCALTAAFSIKSAPYPIAFCLIIAAVNGGFRDRLVISSVFASALAVFVYVMVYALPVADVDRLVFWDLIQNEVEKTDSNPFLSRGDVATMVRKNAVMGALLIGGLLAPLPPGVAVRGMKIYVGLGLALWLAAGVYYTFAPDFMKIVHIYPFSAVRTLRWPQTITYLLIVLGVLKWLKDRRNLRSIIGATLVLATLLVIGPGNHGMWTGLFAASIAVVFAVDWLRTRLAGSPTRPDGGAVPWIAGRYPLLLAQALALTIAVALASTIWKNMPYWQTWAVHGVYGNSPVAQWIGIAEYLRRNTPGDAVILPLEEEKPGELKARRHLASRSGRAIAAMMEYSSIFDLKAWQFEKEQRETVNRLGAAVINQNWQTAVEWLKRVKPEPDYVLIPEKYMDDALFKFLPLDEMTRMRGYAILKRKTPGK